MSATPLLLPYTIAAWPPCCCWLLYFYKPTSDAGVTAIAGTIGLSGVTGVAGVAAVGGIADVEVSAVIFVLLLLAWCHYLFKTDIFN